MPGLPFGNLFLSAMVEADIRDDIDDFLARELRHESKHAVRAGMGRAEVDEHIVEVGVVVVMGAG